MSYFNEIYIRISDTQFKRLILSPEEDATLIVNDGKDNQLNFLIEPSETGCEVTDTFGLDIVGIEDIEIPSVESINLLESFSSSVESVLNDSLVDLQKVREKFEIPSEEFDTSSISVENADEPHVQSTYETDGNGILNEDVEHQEEIETEEDSDIDSGAGSDASEDDDRELDIDSDNSSFEDGDFSNYEDDFNIESDDDSDDDVDPYSAMEEDE